MSSLLAALQSSASSLNVFGQALGVEQSNIANASTAGYAAQRATILPIDSSGGGIHSGDFIALSSTGDLRTDALVQSASSQASFSQTSTQQLVPVNQIFDITGSTGILAALQQFSTAFSNLSVTPNDTTLGAAVLSAAGSVASAFRSAATQLDTQGSQVDSSIQSTTNQINQLSAQVRQFNVQILGETQPSAGADASLRSALDQLSSLVDINVTKSADGSVTVLAGGSLPLVQGSQSYSLTANPSAAPGAQIISSAGGSSPQSFSGQLGALLNTRNGTIGQLLGSNGAAGSLNSLAAGFASRVNALLSAGTNAAGGAGVPIFVYDATNPSNVARTLTVDPTVSTAQLGLAAQGPPALSNGIANQLAALPGSNVPADQIGGLSAQTFFGSIASSIGQQLSGARTASVSDQTNLTATQASRQQQSGVSLDQEAVTITAYERSWQAAAKVISIVDQLTSDTVNLIR